MNIQPGTSRGKLMLSAASLGLRLEKVEQNGKWKVCAMKSTANESDTIYLAEDKSEHTQEINNTPTHVPRLSEDTQEPIEAGKIDEHHLETNKEVVPSTHDSSSDSFDSAPSEFDDSEGGPNYSDSSSSSSSSSIRSSSSWSCNENRAPNLVNDSENSPKKTRKRKANPQDWKRNVTKMLRNTGQAYFTSKGGKNVPARKLQQPCGDKCTLKCSTKFTQLEREQFFKDYWSQGNIDRQRNFISRCMFPINPGYRYPTGNRAARNVNHAFYFEKNDTRIRICKKFLVATLGITNRTIRTVISKSKDGFVTNDERGKHNNHLTISNELKESVRTHIKSIPVIESHYTRATTSKNYIEGGKTITQLYEDYKKDRFSQDLDFVKFPIYRNIFNYEFNLAFFKPKKDLCQVCETYRNSNDEEKEQKKTDYESHHEEKDLSRKEKEEDKNKINESNLVACFDLQAALPTPKGEVSVFYYKSKLLTYNFTICELQKQGLGTINYFIWHEGEGKRGSNEVGSCLISFLNGISNSSEGNLNITFYSDNCGGQCKNKFIVTSYIYTVSCFKFESVTHKFLVVGHTQNEGDCAYSLIERAIKRCLRSGPIYVPSQYSAIISTSKRTGKPIKVFELDHKSFFDIKDLTDQMATNFNVDESGKKFNFNDICVIKVEKRNPNNFFLNLVYKEQEFRCVNVKSAKTRRSLVNNVEAIDLKKAYSRPTSISKKKFDDLQSLVANKTIPSCHADFYNSLKYE